MDNDPYKHFFLQLSAIQHSRVHTLIKALETNLGFSMLPKKT